MNHDLQWWASLTQIISLPLSTLSLLVAIAQYLWPRPNIPRIPLWIITGMLGFSLGLFIISFLSGIFFSQDGNKTFVESVPFQIVTYSGIHEKDGPDTWNIQLARADLSILNDINGNVDYKFSSYIADEIDAYAGIAFKFPKPQDLSQYEAVEIRMIFEDLSTRCNFKLVDTDNTPAYISQIGSNILSGEGTTVNINGNEHNIKIPLRTNFKSLNLYAIKEIAFSTGDSSTFTVTEVTFVR